MGKYSTGLPHWPGLPIDWQRSIPQTMEKPKKPKIPIILKVFCFDRPKKTKIPIILKVFYFDGPKKPKIPIILKVFGIDISFPKVQMAFSLPILVFLRWGVPNQRGF